MPKKSKIDVLNNMTKEELKRAISKYVGPHRTYQRLIAMQLIIDGKSHKEVAETLGVTYPTINRWAKKCEKEGIEGLTPNFGGGRPSYLTDEQKEELDALIQEQDYLDYKELHELILRKFKVNHSMKQIGVSRKELGHNYPRRSPIFKQSPPNADEEFKKNPRSKYKIK